MIQRPKLLSTIREARIPNKWRMRRRACFRLRRWTNSYRGKGRHVPRCGRRNTFKNPIEHGNVDSIIGFYGTYGAGTEKIVRYWLAVGDSIESVLDLNSYVLKKSPEHLIQTSRNYWKAWSIDIHGVFTRCLPKPLLSLGNLSCSFEHMSMMAEESSLLLMLVSCNTVKIHMLMSATRCCLCRARARPCR